MNNIDFEQRLAMSERMSGIYIEELERKIEYLESYMAKYGEQPFPGRDGDDTDEVASLRRLLVKARAQRDATQGALDKANRDNDGLRAELGEARRRAAEFEELYRAADRSVQRFISRDEAKALVDGGVVEYYTEDEEE